MAKQLTCQRLIFKITTDRLKKAKWNLSLSLKEARINEEIISLGDSQILRWIDELNGISNSEILVKSIRKQIKSLKKESDSFQNRKEIKRLYEQLDEIQFKKDYLCLVIDKNKDYYRACKGFKVNGIKYTRLLGTSGGVKNRTIVFVNEELAPELRKRIDNGRDKFRTINPHKFEAYRALVCSGSIPVSYPKGIAVVDDCTTYFHEDVIEMKDGDGSEPIMTYVKDKEIELCESDGYGLMLPSLASRWSDELHLDYVASGMNTRCSWEKGMVFTFDFLEFADKVAGTRVITDVWGNKIDLSNVELILTASMLKLWESYTSIDHYIACCKENHYTFGVPKVAPYELENERSLNYQFIQSYRLSDEEIDELISPTMDTIRNVLSGDYRRAILFLKGCYLTDRDVENLDNDFVKAMMIDRRVHDDPYVRHAIFNMIKKRINEAKVGVIQVHGNYSIICGDPYSLCQNIFGIPVTGLLKKGELYSKYWVDCGAEKVACFRAPMTCHNNIRVLNVSSDEEKEHWYRYMKTVTLLNSWDSTAHALNGADKDGDIVLLTDNRVLVEKHIKEPAIMCEQRKGSKTIPDEDTLINANVDSFGDEIGKDTNRITSMFDVQAAYDQDTEEYKILDYRIKAGQHFQQSDIDRTKGIIAKPMPKYWYDRQAKRSESDGEAVVDDSSIAAHVKPYFMIYIYPKLRQQYLTYAKNTDKKCLREFGMSIDEITKIPKESRADEQNEFLEYYYNRMPVGNNNCIMNRICRKFEDEFDKKLKDKSVFGTFNYNFMKSGGEYTKSQFNAVKKEYYEYLSRTETLMRILKSSKTDSDYMKEVMGLLKSEYKSKCLGVCSNESTLCDILLDVCYSSEKSKSFVWEMCADTIISNLLSANGNLIEYPVEDNDGAIRFNGKTFNMKTKELSNI